MIILLSIQLRWPSFTSRCEQESAVVFSSEGTAKSAAAAYVSIIPTLGAKVKSVKYNSKRELVPGSHEVVRLRVASVDVGERWVAAINKAATHTVCRF
jgi:hypothetical protein